MNEYIQDNYHPDDRLAVALKNKEGRFRQYVVSAKEIAEPRFLSWLKEQNDGGENIYVSTNALKDGANGRTKQDVAAVRHIYLDIDYNGRDALARISADADAPQPSYIINTSLDKFQVVWKVTGFSANEAEALQKTMVARYGADPTVTDVARVLRVPGFTNRKYDPPFIVTAEKLSDLTYQPSDFHIDRQYEHSSVTARNPQNQAPVKSHSGRASARDWAETCRRLERGDNPDDVRNWLEQHRHDKHNREYYADLTVRKALAYVSEKITNLSIEQIAPANAGGGAVQNITNNKQEDNMDTNNKRYYLEGDNRAIFEIRGELRNLGFDFDRTDGINLWFTKDPAMLEKAKELLAEELKRPAYQKQKETDGKDNTDKEIYIIGYAPEGLGKDLGKKGLGMQWDENTGWHTYDPAKAQAAHEKILAAQPRYYLEGNTFAVRDMIAARNNEADSPSRRIFFDPYLRKQYATNPEFHSEIQALIPQKTEREKLYLEGNSNAVYAIREQLKNITIQNKNGVEKKAFAFDIHTEQWYTYHQEALKRAQALLDAELKNPKYQERETAKERAKENENAPKYYLEGNSKAIFAIKEQLKELNFRFDGKNGKDQWFTHDPAILEKAQAILAEELKKPEYQPAKSGVSTEQAAKTTGIERQTGANVVLAATSAAETVPHPDTGGMDWM